MTSNSEQVEFLDSIRQRSWSTCTRRMLTRQRRKPRRWRAVAQWWALDDTTGAREGDTYEIAVLNACAAQMLVRRQPPTCIGAPQPGYLHSPTRDGVAVGRNPGRSIFHGAQHRTGTKPHGCPGWRHETQRHVRRHDKHDQKKRTGEPAFHVHHPNSSRPQSLGNSSPISR